ncbi:helix-turn-helix transcriptional regulator [Nostoc sp. ChiQUE01b]|uniref:helix-turn-helix domain-containing protein n=1 Tax=Nostoc sp. ChiQUE01b TaxID=3075376 RepID=UPI002AD2D2ED|nr:helix-turn-helix transcriptional regulator [Nostoc sp. ChiQUE01b]MDZ8258393.1 helix-turn-helix transcriptional regulator [Nostoc sp. ChiQUE01b]
MGKVGIALRQTLETYNISQNKLSVIMRVKPFVIFRWYHEQTDPSGETILNIAKALQSIEPAAAGEFIRLYAGDFLPDQEKS